MNDSNESVTAKLCSYARANHSFCEGCKIFDDSYAYKLMGSREYKETEKILAEKFFISDTNDFVNKYICPIVLPRSAYSESRLLQFLTQYGKIQYVILGAGMDTFSIRNKNKDIDIFELDHPLTQKYKLKRIHDIDIEIPSNVSFLPINFEQEEIKNVLSESKFDFKKPSFFSFLGVTYYLDENSIENTIKNISDVSNSNTEIVMDFPDKQIFETERAKILANITASVGEPMSSGIKYSKIQQILEKYGFKIKNHLAPEDIQKKYLKTSNKLTAYKNIYFITAKKEG